MEKKTLLLIDLVDSTQMLQRLGDAQAADVLSKHDRMARDLLREYGGTEIDKTDGFLLLFDDPIQGLRYAVDYHRQLGEVTTACVLSARVGMHVGTLVLRKNAPADVARGAKLVEAEGIAKPTAARVMSLATANQTLLTNAAWEAVQEHLPRDLVAVTHGHYRLKGVAEPVAVHEVGDAHAAPLTPPGDAPKSFRVIRTSDGWEGIGQIANNLPRSLNRFIGRRDELLRIAREFETGTSLLTLQGPGGSGKTRLAMQYARGWLGSYPAGAWLCDLSSATDATQATLAVARAMGLGVGGHDLVEDLGLCLADMGRALVILDNFEQVVNSANIVSRWLQAAPEVRILVTSREVLQLQGERVHQIGPLSVPAPGASQALIRQSDAVRLFVEWSRSVGSNMELNADDYEAIAKIVRILDGLPLAIELATAQARSLRPTQTLERISKRFDVLRGTRRDATERHATLRSTIDWSWGLLEPWEQSALAQCSVYQGGFRLEAAEYAIDIDEWGVSPVDVVTALCDKSLLRRWEVKGHTRFGMLNITHGYASERLAEMELGDSVAQRHAEYYSHLGHPGVFEVRDEPQKLAMLDSERGNLAAAAKAAIAGGWGIEGALSVIALCEIVHRRGPISGALAFADSDYGELPPGPAIRLHASLGNLARIGGLLEVSAARLEEATEIQKSHGLLEWEHYLLWHMGRLCLDRGQTDEAIAHWEELLRKTGTPGHPILSGIDAKSRRTAVAGGIYFKDDREVRVMARGYQGLALALKGDFEAAEEALLEAAALADGAGALVTGSVDILHAETLMFRTGDARAAEPYARRAHELLQRTHSKRMTAIALCAMAPVYAASGQRGKAIEAAEEAVKLLHRVGDRLNLGRALVRLAAVAPAGEPWLDEARAIHADCGAPPRSLLAQLIERSVALRLETAS